MLGDYPLLSVHDLWCYKTKDQPTLLDVSFDVHSGDTVVLSGRSGSGKTTLLKCLSHLNMYQGDVLLHGRKATHYGIPLYRTLVQYVPQRPSLLPGTPRTFVDVILSYSSRKSAKHEGRDTQSSQKGFNGFKYLYSQAIASPTKPGAMFGPIRIAEKWGVDEELWDRPWSKLSGGESQRIALAIAIGIPGAEILLLDEPTSALDATTTMLVETSLQGLIKDEDSTVKAIIWITHSEEQGRRVGTRFLCLEAGGCFDTVEMGLPPSRRSRSETASPSLPI